MLGWQTRSYTDKLLYHHRVTGAAVANRFMLHFNDGKKDYMFGGHPLWEMFRAAYRVQRKPLIAGACFLLAGYFWCLATRVERPVTRELIEFRRREQMIRLRRLFSGLLATSTRDSMPAFQHRTARRR
jgi:hypothetical protein